METFVFYVTTPQGMVDESARRAKRHAMVCETYLQPVISS